MKTGYNLFLKLIMVFFLLGSGFFPVFAQNDTGNEISTSPDTTRINGKERETINSDTTINAPRKASLYSMVLPGLGQAYNQEYWKIPIIYSGGLVLGYFVDLYNTKYHIYRRALVAINSEGPPRNNPFPDYVNKDRLTRGKDFYRRNRDYVMILSVGLYLLQVVDAHVDAHLKDFQITEELSIQFNPNIDKFASPSAAMAMGNSQIGIGFSINLKFNQ